MFMLTTLLVSIHYTVSYSGPPREFRGPGALSGNGALYKIN